MKAKKGLTVQYTKLQQEIIMKHYETLMTLPGTPGDESEIKIYVRKVIEAFPQYEIIEDHLGSIFAYKKGTSTFKVMVAGHMDEVGFMIVGITKQGMLNIQPVGGIDPSIVSAQTYDIHTHKGIIKGYIGAIPPHLKLDQQLEFEKILVDIGASSKEEAVELGIQLGDRMTFEPKFIQLTENRYLAKAVDNRYGVGLALQMIEAFKDESLEYDLYIGATVQEEVGLRGAETSINMIEPDVFIALDASPMNDTDKPSDNGLNQGFLLRMFDPRNTMPEYLKQNIISLAKKHDIPYQHYISKGGTDAAKALDMHQGIVATTIGLPSRYIHSPAAIFDTRDLDACYQMTYTLLKNLNQVSIKKLKKGEFNVL
jgi:glutamyl aminopeptidase